MLEGAKHRVELARGAASFGWSTLLNRPRVRNIRCVAPPFGMPQPETALIGISAAIRLVEGEMDDSARSDAKVPITGESGVGKEIAAQLIHQRSRRAHLPIVTINCAGIPDSLLESELFGHVRGSFTNAYRDRPGPFEMADGGTIFMDEGGEMSLRRPAL